MTRTSFESGGHHFDLEVRHVEPGLLEVTVRWSGALPKPTFSCEIIDGNAIGAYYLDSDREAGDPIGPPIWATEAVARHLRGDL